MPTSQGLAWSALTWGVPTAADTYPPPPPMRPAAVAGVPGGVEVPAGSGLVVNAGGTLELSITTLPTSPGASGTFWNSGGLLAVAP